MRHDVQTKPAQVVVLEPKTTHPTPRLATAADIRREMAALYRDARGGRLAVDDASRFAYILTQLAQMVRLDELEQRTAALELAMRMQQPPKKR